MVANEFAYSWWFHWCFIFFFFKHLLFLLTLSCLITCLFPFTHTRFDTFVTRLGFTEVSYMYLLDRVLIKVIYSLCVFIQCSGYFGLKGFVFGAVFLSRLYFSLHLLDLLCGCVHYFGKSNPKNKNIKRDWKYKDLIKTFKNTQVMFVCGF